MWGVSIYKIDLEFGKAFATYLLKQAEKTIGGRTFKNP